LEGRGYIPSGIFQRVTREVEVEEGVVGEKHSAQVTGSLLPDVVVLKVLKRVRGSSRGKSTKKNQNCD
jgi:hypothetical protein